MFLSFSYYKGLELNLKRKFGGGKKSIWSNFLKVLIKAHLSRETRKYIALFLQKFEKVYLCGSLEEGSLCDILFKAWYDVKYIITTVLK